MADHPKHWTVRRSRRRVAPFWEVRNTRGVVAVVYGTKADADCMASAPRVTFELGKAVAELKSLIAIVQRHEGELRASEKASLERARALINEHK